MIDNILAVNPPHHIYAYVLSRTVGRRLQLGVAVDTKTGKTLESVVLPTKQRIQLALGIGNDEAQAHRTYKRTTKDNYVLHWTDHPEREEALLEMSEMLKRVSVGVQRAIKQPEITASTERQIENEHMLVKREDVLAERHDPKDGFAERFVAASTAQVLPTKEVVEPPTKPSGWGF